MWCCFEYRAAETRREDVVAHGWRRRMGYRRPERRITETGREDVGTSSSWRRRARLNVVGSSTEARSESVATSGRRLESAHRSIHTRTKASAKGCRGGGKHWRCGGRRNERSVVKSRCESSFGTEWLWGGAERLTKATGSKGVSGCRLGRGTGRHAGRCTSCGSSACTAGKAIGTCSWRWRAPEWHFRRRRAKPSSKGT